MRIQNFTKPLLLLGLMSLIISPLTVSSEELASINRSADELDRCPAGSQLIFNKVSTEKAQVYREYAATIDPALEWDVEAYIEELEQRTLCVSFQFIPPSNGGGWSSDTECMSSSTWINSLIDEQEMAEPGDGIIVNKPQGWSIKQLVQLWEKHANICVTRLPGSDDTRYSVLPTTPIINDGSLRYELGEEAVIYRPTLSDR